MLQVSTGKFFKTDELHVTEHRGILYTNYWHREAIETCVGDLVPTTPWRGISTSVYEGVERLPEKRPDGQDSVLISVGGQPLLQDFAAVVSFCLNITLDPHEGLVKRLVAAREPALGITQLPKKYVGRVFDSRIRPTPDDSRRLQEFTDPLVALERHAYERAMRAIRQYVTGLHRIGDDLSLAYTLLVSAVESLAQDFEGFETGWEDVDDRKRNAVDVALENASSDVAAEVRHALVEHEHLALSRRFIAFTLEHLEPSFFREEARDEARPIRRSALPIALKQAYRFRSRYLHSVQEIPRPLTHMPSRGDVRKIDRSPALTLHGLARVGRHVIHRFVEKAPESEEEEFDYKEALPNVVTMPMAPKYWIWKEKGYDHTSARRYLSGFLKELSSSYNGESEAGLTDISDILAKIEKEVAGLALPKQRLPMLTLYYLWNISMNEEHRCADWQVLVDWFADDFVEPSAESMLVHVLTGEDLPWAVDECERIWREYVEQRHHKDGLVIPRLFEAGVCLSFAEKCRTDDHDDRVCRWIARAVEVLPGNEALIEIEERSQGAGQLPAIDWQEVLITEEEGSENTGS